ncbi:MAG: hypothetical protein E6I75_15685 [Chloroflexi bacterium]|nr:MAG: hypothetical protein E6I75_15685 [Chloroflexota bacterium]
MQACEPLAVTGLACRLPGAPDAEAFWRNVREARVAPTRSLEERWGIPRRRYIGRAGDADRTYTDLAFCLDTDSGAGDRQVELGRHVVDAALADAARVGRPLDLSRTALVAATSWTAPSYFEHDVARALAAVGVAQATPPTGIAHPPDLQLGAIAPRLGGPRLAVDTACASSLYALDLAAGLVETGQADAVVVLGLNGFLPPFLYIGFARLMALSPEGRIRPFAIDASGIVPGEGAGAVILEPLDAARAGRRHVHGIVRTIGLAADGAERSIFAPGANGQRLVYERAYAELDPATVDYIEAHGTATVVGDATEIQSLHGFFGPHRPRGAKLAIGSVKALVGHTLAAAGIASLIKTLLMLRDGLIPPHIAVSPHPALAETCLMLPDALTAWPDRDGRPRRAGISAFGFGGANAHIVVESDTGESRPAGPRPRPVAEPLAVLDAEALLPLPERLRMDAAGLRTGPNLLRRIDPLQLAVTHLASELLARNPAANQAAGTGVVIASNLGGQMSRRLSRKYAYRLGTDAPDEAIELRLGPPLTVEAIASSLPTMCSGYPSYHFDLRAMHQTLSGDSATFITSLLLAPYWLRTRCDTLLLGAARDGEGACLLLLKPLSRARANGDRILAVVRSDDGTGPLQADVHEALDLSPTTGRERFAEATGMDVLVRALGNGALHTRVEVREAGQPRAVLLIEKEERADPPPRAPRVPFEVVLRDGDALKAPPSDNGHRPRHHHETVQPAPEHRSLAAAWVTSTAATVRAFLAAQRDGLALLDIEPAEPPIGPRTPEHAVIDRVSAHGGTAHADLIVDEAHSYFFDHPLDHVPGILLIEGALQLADHIPGARGRFVRLVEFRFRRFCEKQERATFEARYERTVDVIRFDGRVVQQGRELCTFGLELVPLATTQPGATTESNPGRGRPVEAVLLHKLHPDNVLVAALDQRDGTCTILPPPPGHFFATGDPRLHSPLYVLEAARQAVIQAAHSVLEIPRGMAMNLIDARLVLAAPVPREVPLQLRLAPESPKRLGTMLLAEVNATLLAAGRELGTASIKAQVVEQDTYRRSRGGRA